MSRHRELAAACVALAAITAAWAAAVLLPAPAHAAPSASVGPAVVAKADLSLWPEAIDQRAGYDKASRAAILVYVGVLGEMRKLSDADMMAAFSIRSVNRASTDKWLQRELEQATANYRAAAAKCAEGSANKDWTCLPTLPPSPTEFSSAAIEWQARVPGASAAWRANLAAFSRAYLAEQMRLAALFPKISSEIDRFGDNEWTGDALPDGQFLLSFDDGPTPPGGSTDETLRMLASQQRSAVFFMLGGNLQARASKLGAPALAQAYQGQCVASHGWEHQSHARWDGWQDSVRRTQALLQASFGKDQILPWFRPPYGQRTADSGAFFTEQGLQVALWNLDSQDWNARVTAADVTDRMVTLMLIKRHGVMLFHDVHAKAFVALPTLFAKVGEAVVWRDCHAGPR